MSLSKGTRIGPYEVLARLADGGEVYRARDTRGGREVALELHTDPGAQRRLKEAARIAGAIGHASVLAVYDAGEHEGKEFLASEWLDGRSLAESLTAGPLTRKKALGLAMQVAQGLWAAHEKGIVHGALDSESVFVTADGRAKIVDFGQPVARAAPACRSPEQIRGEPADARSDLFSFGCVLHQMLSGKRPFAGETQAALDVAVLRDPPLSLGPDAPQSVSALVAKCLQKAPADRFPNAKELAAQIAQCLAMDHLSIATPAPGAYARLNALADVLGRPVGPETARVALRDLTGELKPAKNPPQPKPQPKPARPMGLLLAIAAAVIASALALFLMRR